MKKDIYNNLINKIPIKLSNDGYISVWLSNSDGAYDTEYSKILINKYNYIKNNVDNLNDRDNKIVRTSEVDTENGGFILLDIPELTKYISTSGNQNEGYKYLRIRYALHEDDLDNKLYSKTGEIEEYKLKVIRGLDIRFDSDHEDHKDKSATTVGTTDGDLYQPLDLGFYPNTWDVNGATNTEDSWEPINTESDRVRLEGGKADGYIGKNEYVKHRIKITNPVDYPQKGKEFYFTTNLSKVVGLNGEGTPSVKVIAEGTIPTVTIEKVNTSSLPDIKDNVYKIKISELAEKQAIYIEFVEQLANEYIDDGQDVDDWKLVEKIYVDKEEPDSSEEIIKLRKHSVNLLRDYGSGAGIEANEKSTAQRHYLAKLDGKFVELGGTTWEYTIPGTDGDKGTLIDKPIAFEDVPTPDDDIDENEHGVAIRGGKLKTLNNNYKNKIFVYPSHDGFIRIQMTTVGTRDSDSLEKATWTDATSVVDILTTEDATVDGPDNGIKTYVEVVGGEANTIYVQTPNLPNTYQLMRVKYALDEEDLLSDDGVGRTGEIEDYVVKLAAGIEARFVDSINKGDGNYTDDTLIEQTVLHHSTVDKFVQDLGIKVDRGGIDTTSIAESEDFGSGTRAGYHDGHLIPGEDFIELIRIHNFTILDQTGDVKVIVRLKNEEFVDLNPQLFHNQNITDKASIEAVNKNVSYISNTGEYDSYIRSISKVETPDEGFDRQYEIILNGLGAHKAVYLKFRARVLGEGDGEVFGDIHIEEYDDLDKDFDTVTRKLEKDYGSKYYQNETSRHYVASVIDTENITTDNVKVVNFTSIIKDLTKDNSESHLIKLGDTVSIEDEAKVEFSKDNGLSLPEYSGVTVGGENEFKGIITSNEAEKDKTIVLYNNFNNLIPVRASRNGYIRFWLSDINTKNWESLTRGKGKEPTMNSEDTDAPSSNSLFIVNGSTNTVPVENQLFVKLGDVLKTDKAGQRAFYSSDPTYILRARYSLLKDDFKGNISGEGYNAIGEVEDYKVKVIPGFEINFEETLDLGVPVNETKLDTMLDSTGLGLRKDNVENFKLSMVGTKDGNIGLGEYVLQTITITNLSKLPQENQTLKLRINNGIITDLITLESITRNFDLDTNDNANESRAETKIIPKDQITNRLTVSDIKVPNQDDKGYYNHNIEIPNISGRETLKLTYLVKIVSENTIEVTDKDNNKDAPWKFIQKAYDSVTNIQLAQKDNHMYRDYGDNLIGTYTDQEDKHYTTSGDINPAYLGDNVTSEEKPMLSDDNDGVVFGVVSATRSSEVTQNNILYNNMRNKIIVKAKHDGYISLFLSNGQGTDYTWEDDEVKQLEIEVEPTNVNTEKVLVYEVVKGSNEVSFIVPELDLVTSNKVLRVKYAVHKSDLEDESATVGELATATVHTGEVEDYKVKIAAGIDVMFGESIEEKETYKPLDYGVLCEIHNDKSLGDRDGYYAPNEIIEHTITIVNNVNEDQIDKELVFNSNIGKLLINGYENRKPFIYITDTTNGIIDENIIPTTVEGISGNSYLIKIINIKAQSKITIKLKFQQQ